MQRDFSSRATGSFFVAAAAMVWLGWMLLPVHIGEFFRPGDFDAVYSQRRFWIWMFRLHLFGMITTVIALAALGTLVSQAAARVLVWPGAAVATAGLTVGAVGAAFYYHFGAWGALDMHGKSAAELQAFVESLRVTTEYVTCLVRFGRVFTGLGLLLMAAGLMKGRILPTALTGSAALLGLAAMGLTMFFPDNLEYFTPVFHAQSLWLAATGLVLLTRGVRNSDSERAA
jgi:hypothetical protein